MVHGKESGDDESPLYPTPESTNFEEIRLPFQVPLPLGSHSRSHYSMVDRSRSSRAPPIMHPPLLILEGYGYEYESR